MEKGRKYVATIDKQKFTFWREKKVKNHPWIFAFYEEEGYKKIRVATVNPIHTKASYWILLYKGKFSGKDFKLMEKNRPWLLAQLKNYLL